MNNVDVDENPDRSNQYTDSNPAKLRDQLNENWRQLRLFRAALSDRDKVISELHESIFRRDKLIGNQNQKLVLMNRARPYIYAMLGGIATEIVKLIIDLVIVRR